MKHRTWTLRASSACASNHARNSAVLRDFDDHIALTPLFDFAPMYLHPDGIARRIRWSNNDFGRTNWHQVIDRVCELGAVVRKERRWKRALIEREPLVVGLKAMEPKLRELTVAGEAMGLEPEVATFLRPHFLAMADALAALV